jgi:hypothetical protein
MNFTPDNIISLKPYEVFVFGSNEKGIHGAGAARIACKLFGAEMGKGFGRTGQTFAIPTKDYNIQTLGLDAIEIYVRAFIEESKNYSYLTFLVTQIGCGLAGWTAKDIAPMFVGAPENIILPKEFWEVLNQDCK